MSKEQRDTEPGAHVGDFDALLVDAMAHPDPTARARAYQKVIRRGQIIARRLMSDKARAGGLESMDICMSVLANLSTRIEENDVRFENPGKLLAYLRKAIDHKVGQRTRTKIFALLAGNTAPIGASADDGEIDPDQFVLGGEEAIRSKELRAALTEARRQAKDAKSAAERRVIEARDQDPPEPYDEIAAEVGLSADNCRKIYSRYLDEVREQIRAKGYSAPTREQQRAE